MNLTPVLTPLPAVPAQLQDPFTGGNAIIKDDLANVSKIETFEFY